MFRTRKIDQKGFSHHLVIILAVVLLAAGGVGYYVWHKNNNVAAKAAGWTKLLDETANYEPGRPGVERVYACRGKLAGQGNYVVKFIGYYNIPMNAIEDVGISDTPSGSVVRTHELPVRGYSYTYYNTTGKLSQYAFVEWGKHVKIGELESC